MEELTVNRIAYLEDSVDREMNSINTVFEYFAAFFQKKYTWGSIREFVDEPEDTYKKRNPCNRKRFL